MQMAVHVCASGLALSLAFLGASAPAAAAPKPITGKLSKPGYTVIAVAADGRATSVRATRGTFRLRPRAGSVTLHLRGPDGVYAGPIVVRRERNGKRAILGVRAGARLGGIKIRSGYATIAKRLSEKWVDPRRRARARKGVPIGARVFGRVRSKPPRTSVAGDKDLDGVPNPLDVDDDGDLIFDNIDRLTTGGRARASQGGGCGPENIYCPVFNSGLVLFMENTVNANARDPSGAPAFTDGQINTALSSFGSLNIDVPRSDSAELDCAGDPLASPPRPGLVYCSTGGTGRASAGGPGGPPFPGPRGDPSSFDPDGDGFGRLDSSLAPLACPGCDPSDFFVAHGATTDQIKTGDLVIEWVANGIPESQCPPPSASCTSTVGTLQYVFATVPALVSYRDTAGNSATVSYPVAGPTPGCPPPGCPPGGLGTPGNGFPVAPGPNGQIVLTLTFWRPQRKAIPESDPPAATWMDVGRLTYGAGLSGEGNSGCPEDAFLPADSPDPNLTLTPSTPRPLGTGWGFTDQKVDEVASPGNTLTYKLNLSTCLAADGVGSSFDESGEERMVSFKAAPGRPDIVFQFVFFKRQ